MPGWMPSISKPNSNTCCISLLKYGEFHMADQPALHPCFELPSAGALRQILGWGLVLLSHREGPLLTNAQNAQTSCACPPHKPLQHTHVLGVMAPSTQGARGVLAHLQQPLHRGPRRSGGFRASYGRRYTQHVPALRARPRHLRDCVMSASKAWLICCKVVLNELWWHF